jgi:nucleoside-diphosphate-sugar epimerase
VLAERPAKVILLAAQASRPLAESDPDYTEETNVTGARRVAEAVAELGVPLVYGSSAHVYGSELEGEIGPDHPYGAQHDLSHLSKVYAELCLRLYARRTGFDLSLLRLGIVYGPSPVEHARPESQTVVDKFKRLAATGDELPLDDGGRATIGVVHVEDAARILLGSPRSPLEIENVVAETTTVGAVAALLQGGDAAEPAWTFTSPFDYRHRLAEYL